MKGEGVGGDRFVKTKEDIILYKYTGAVLSHYRALRQFATFTQFWLKHISTLTNFQFSQYESDKQWSEHLVKVVNLTGWLFYNGWSVKAFVS